MKHRQKLLTIIDSNKFSHFLSNNLKKYFTIISL